MDVASAASSRDSNDKPRRFSGFFGVHDCPASSLFPAFKRQFLASVAYGRGFIEIQSKTKAKAMVRLSVSDLRGMPFIKQSQPNVICFVNNNRFHNRDWTTIEIRADNSQMAEAFQETLVRYAWPPQVLPTGRATTGPTFNVPRTPLTPAAAATQRTGTLSAARPASAAAQKTCNVTTPTAANNAAVGNVENYGFKAPLPSPLTTSTPRGEDNDCRPLDGTTMTIRINQGNPAESSVVQPSLFLHRPIEPARVKREITESSTNLIDVAPSPQMDVESERMLRTFGLNLSNSGPRAQSAARMLQFGDASGGHQPESQMAPRTGFLMQRMLHEPQQMHQQPHIGVGQFNNGPGSPDVNVDTEASFLQTPVHSPLSHDMQQSQQQTMLQQLINGMQGNPMSPFGGAMGGLSNTQTLDLNNSFGGLNGSGGGTLMAYDDVNEYRTYAAEFEKIAAEFWKKSDEKAYLARDTMRLMANLMSTLNC